MDEQLAPPRTLERITERSNILAFHWQWMAEDIPASVALARPLFEAGMISCGIAQRAFPYDSGIHTPDRYRFSLLLRGAMTVQFEDQEYRLSPGQLACCTPGTRFKRSADGKIWWLFFDFANNKIWGPLKEHGAYIRDHQCPDLVYILLQHLMDLQWLYKKGPFDDHPEIPRHPDISEEDIAQATTYAGMLLTILMRETTMIDQHADQTLNRLHILRQQIRLSPHQNWSVEMMSQRLHVSSSTLKRLTMSEYGISPMQLVIQARLEQAVALLKSRKNTIESVAHHVGYESVYSFSRLFAKHLGMPPGQYRDEVLHKEG